jgi:hypothetical protein
MAKFADDFFIASLISNKDDFLEYQEAINTVTAELTVQDLQINNEKRKEMIFDFTLNQRLTNLLPQTLVCNDPVVRVSTLKMVGYHINDKFTNCDHVSELLAKGNSRLFLLYKMSSMHLPKEVLMAFYNGGIRSPLEFAAPAFHHKLTIQEAKSLERIQKRALKVLSQVGGDVEGIASLSERRAELCSSFLEKLISNSSSLIPPAQELRNGKMIPQSFARTERHKQTFVPSQIAIFNSNHVQNPKTTLAHSCYQQH